MAGIIPQPVTLNFSQGVNLKSDPWQIPLGQFLALENSVFTTQGQLKKRNGYGLITTIPEAATITTYLGNLVSLSDELNIYSQDTNTVIDTGPLQPMGLSVLPMVRSATSQTTVDAAVAPNGLCCETWLDGDGSSYYQINDSVTGGIIIPSVSITSATDVNATMPRVAVVGRYFFVTYLSTVSGNASLRYIAIPWASPTMPFAPVTISTAVSNISAAYDILSVNINAGALYLAWEDSGVIKLSYITSSLVPGNIVTLASAPANLISLAWDYTNSQLWVSFYSSGSSTISTAVYNSSLAVILATTVVVIGVTVYNGLTSTATTGSLTLFYEFSNFYGYDSSLRTDYLSTNTCTVGGTPGTPSIILRGVGLSSKAALVNGTNYMLICYSSAYQPTYFLINASGNIIGKVAYANGGGYLINQIMPQINVSTSNGQTVFQIGYLYKDFLASIANPIGPLGSNVGTNKALGAAAPPIYSNTGINVSTWTFNAPVATAETGRILHMGMGFPVMFDGAKPVEHQFHIWPDALEVISTNTGGALAAQQYYWQGIYSWTDGQGNPQYSAPSVPVGQVIAAGSPISFTATFTANSTTLTATSSLTGFYVGQTLTDTSATLPMATSTFAAGVSAIYVSTVTGFSVGQTLIDSTTPGAIQAGTTITEIDPTSKIFFLSLPTATASASPDTLTTTEGGLQANTKIVAISGSTVTINLPTITASGSGLGDTLVTEDTGQALVYFPTLRITDKTTNNVRLNVYRWSAQNQNFYEITSVEDPILNNPAVDYITITDMQNDLAIVGNSLIYTTGGVVEDIAAPSFSICTMFDDRLWIVDNEDPYTMWYSKQVLEGTGVEFSDLFTYYVAPTQGAQGSTGPITALAPMDTELIMFKQDAMFYLNGTGPNNTGANSTYSQPIYISSTVGCSNPNSIVQTDEGLMFQSDKGIWLLSRGLQPQYIGQAVERLVLGNTVTAANIIPGTTQARFILNTGITLLYDYFYKQWGWFTNTPGISATLYNGLHTYLDKYGRIVQETPGKYFDISTPVTMAFMSGWIQLQGLQGYQRFLELQFLGLYISPHNLNVAFGYDYGPLDEEATIEPINGTGTYGSDLLYGQTSPYGGPKNLEQWRVQNATQQCQSFQVSFQEVYDPTQGVPAGAGLTISAFTAIVGITRGYRPTKASTTVGTM
jgi:hypothetical protein